jgi:hypothetical protein
MSHQLWHQCGNGPSLTLLGGELIMTRIRRGYKSPISDYQRLYQYNLACKPIVSCTKRRHNSAKRSTYLLSSIARPRAPFTIFWVTRIYSMCSYFDGASTSSSFGVGREHLISLSEPLIHSISFTSLNQRVRQKTFVFGYFDCAGFQSHGPPVVFRSAHRKYLWWNSQSQGA